MTECKVRNDIRVVIEVANCFVMPTETEASQTGLGFLRFLGCARNDSKELFGMIVRLV